MTNHRPAVQAKKLIRSELAGLAAEIESLLASMSLDRLKGAPKALTTRQGRIDGIGHSEWDFLDGYDVRDIRRWQALHKVNRDQGPPIDGSIVEDMLTKVRDHLGQPDMDSWGAFAWLAQQWDTAMACRAWARFRRPGYGERVSFSTPLLDELQLPAEALWWSYEDLEDHLATVESEQAQRATALPRDNGPLPPLDLDSTDFWDDEQTNPGVGLDSTSDPVRIMTAWQTSQKPLSKSETLPHPQGLEAKGPAQLPHRPDTALSMSRGLSPVLSDHWPRLCTIVHAWALTDFSTATTLSRPWKPCQRAAASISAAVTLSRGCSHDGQLHRSEARGRCREARYARCAERPMGSRSRRHVPHDGDRPPWRVRVDLGSGPQLPSLWNGPSADVPTGWALPWQRSGSCSSSNVR